MTEDKSKADAADQEHRTPHRARIICGVLLGIAAVLAVLSIRTVCRQGYNCCGTSVGSYCYGRCAKGC
jgi:hypothetical protein